MISGIVEDLKLRRSPIPIGGLEIKLQLSFEGMAQLTDQMKIQLTQSYDFEFNGKQKNDSDMN